MKRMLVLLCAVAAPCLAHAGPTVYTDNFDSAPAGLNLTPPGWSISNGGTVDTVPEGSYGIKCDGGSGNCIDLDGSTLKSGDLVSPSLSLVAGDTYSASFALAGNQRYTAHTDTVSVDFGTTTSSYSLADKTPFTIETLLFTPTTSGSYHLSFLDSSNGNDVGAILDNVKIAAVSAVPEPETYAFIFAGLGLIAFMSRRRKGLTNVRF